jgi:NAD-dependent DNA ligase
MLFGKYQQLSNLRDENIRLGNTELDTETLHGLQEAYLIANHMNWLKSSENLQSNETLSLRYHRRKNNDFISKYAPKVIFTITRKLFGYHLSLHYNHTELL